MRGNSISSQLQHLLFLQLVFQRFVESKRDIRVLSRILRKPFEGKIPDVEFLFADKFLIRHGAVLEVFRRERIEVVLTVGPENVVCDHRVEYPSPRPDPVRGEHQHIVFDVLADFQGSFFGKNGRERTEDMAER